MPDEKSLFDKIFRPTWDSIQRIHGKSKARSDVMREDDPRIYAGSECVAGDNGSTRSKRF
jgi:hypothetical protein